MPEEFFFDGGAITLLVGGQFVDEVADAFGGGRSGQDGVYGDAGPAVVSASPRETASWAVLLMP